MLEEKKEDFLGELAQYNSHFCTSCGKLDIPTASESYGELCQDSNHGDYEAVLTCLHCKANCRVVASHDGNELLRPLQYDDDTLEDAEEDNIKVLLNFFEEHEIDISESSLIARFIYKLISNDLLQYCTNSQIEDQQLAMQFNAGSNFDKVFEGLRELSLQLIDFINVEASEEGETKSIIIFIPTNQISGDVVEEDRGFSHYSDFGMEFLQIEPSCDHQNSEKTVNNTLSITEKGDFAEKEFKQWMDENGYYFVYLQQSTDTMAKAFQKLSNDENSDIKHNPLKRPDFLVQLSGYGTIVADVKNQTVFPDSRNKEESLTLSEIEIKKASNFQAEFALKWWWVFYYEGAWLFTNLQKVNHFTKNETHRFNSKGKIFYSIPVSAFLTHPFGIV